MLYSALKPLLFRLPPETAHNLSLKLLKRSLAGPLAGFLRKRIPASPVELLGLKFPNPVGLAAGLDKNADYIEALAALGFGFIEVGTITPQPQPGNPKPRLFRIENQQAIINRLGFNNKGIDYLIQQVKKTRYDGILGINIGKNKTTPAEKSLEDYLVCLEKAYPYADYITVNISSPNTPGLRDLQQSSALNQLLQGLQEKRHRLTDQHGRQVPLLVKIAPDLDPQGLDDIAKSVSIHRIDGLIISNTTLERPDLGSSPLAHETGGLSGKPLMPLATRVLQAMHQRLQGEIPLIGVGGITSAQDAVDKMNAGAKLVQIYTGFIYRGPRLIKEIVETLETKG